MNAKDYHSLADVDKLNKAEKEPAASTIDVEAGHDTCALFYFSIPDVAQWRAY